MHQTIASKLVSLREKLHLTQDEFAELCGLSRSSIARYETEVNILNRTALQKIAAATNTTVTELLGESSQAVTSLPGILSVTTRRVPLLGTVHCGEPSFAEQEFESYVEAGAEIHADFALRAKGDSMTGARIQDGDIVFIRRQDTVNNGEIAAVLIDDEAALKRIRYLPGGMTMLQAENPAYEPIFIGGEGETRVVRILGKAIAFQGDVK